MATSLRKCPGVAFKAHAKTLLLSEEVCPRRWWCMRFVEVDKLAESDVTSITFLAPKEVYPFCEHYLSVPKEVSDDAYVHSGETLPRRNA